MDVSKLFPTSPIPKSNLTVKELIDLTYQPFFSVPIKERSSNVGDFRYLGFKYTFHRDEKKRLVVFVNLYFYVKGSNADWVKTKKGYKRGKKHPRETYLLVAKFPYNTKVKNMKRLYDVPIQIFSSDPSFKYFFAYVLNKHNAVVTDDEILVRWLGESLIKPPKKNNSDWKVQLTKHFFKFFKFLANHRPKEYLDKKYLLKNDARIVNK